MYHNFVLDRLMGKFIYRKSTFKNNRLSLVIDSINNFYEKVEKKRKKDFKKKKSALVVMHEGCQVVYSLTKILIVVVCYGRLGELIFVMRRELIQIQPPSVCAFPVCPLLYGRLDQVLTLFPLEL